MWVASARNALSFSAPTHFLPAHHVGIQDVRRSSHAAHCGGTKGSSAGSVVVQLGASLTAEICGLAGAERVPRAAHARRRPAIGACRVVQRARRARKRGPAARTPGCGDAVRPGHEAQQAVDAGIRAVAAGPAARPVLGCWRRAGPLASEYRIARAPEPARGRFFAAVPRHRRRRARRVRVWRYPRHDGRHRAPAQGAACPRPRPQGHWRCPHRAGHRRFPQGTALPFAPQRHRALDCAGIPGRNMKGILGISCPDL